MMPLCAARIACIVLLAAACSPAHTQNQATPLPAGEFLRRFGSLPLFGIRPDSTRGISLPASLKPPAGKLDPRLQRTLAAASEADQRGLGHSDSLISVKITTANPLANERVRSTILAQHGSVDAEFDNSIWTQLPPALASQLTASPDVILLSPQEVNHTNRLDHPALTGSALDGLRAAHFEALINQGFTGSGVRVGILDLGFRDYPALVKQGRVHSPRAVRAFPERYGVENQEVHGAACAEIISAAAPGAALYLASFDGYDGRFIEAANWLIGQGVSIISFSAGNSTSPTNGADTISRFIDFTSRRYGVLWVMAAGNDAQKHWTGLSDPGRGGFLRTYRDGSEGIEITALSNHIRLVVRWDDWGADPRRPSATQDIDAYLLAPASDGTRLEPVSQSTDPQNGGASVPLEIIDFSAPNLAGRQFILKLKPRTVTRRLPVHVFLESEGRIFPAVAAGSVLNPASARSALAVGAVDVLTGQVAAYSAQGPTDDNRLKPEVSAPSNTISWAYASGTGRFSGTSASCPHVAAFAAVLRQMHPQLTANELRVLVMRSVVPHGETPPNLSYGYGEIDGRAVTVQRARGLAYSQTQDLPVTVPTEFGGKVTAASLDQLRNLPDRHQEGIMVQLITAQDLYRIGDSMVLGFESSNDSACLLFDRDAAGHYSLLSSASRSVIRLTKGVPEILPDPSSKLEVTGPAGMDELLLICAPQPLNIDEAVWNKNFLPLSVAVHAYMIVDSDH